MAMADIRFIVVAQNQRELTLQQAWEAYLAARDKAEKSRDLRDGVAAGKAWARWLGIFTRHPA